MSDAKIETMVMITGREYEALRAENERLNKSRNKWGQKYNKLLEQHKVTVSQLKAAVWSDSEECKLLTAEVERLRAALERLLRAKNEKDAHGDTPVYQALKAGAWDEARAVLSASQPSPSPWRLIETAPTDGTVVLVFAAERDGLAAFQCTAAYHEDAGWCVDELREVTHWMPLPPPPQKENTND